MIKRPLTFMALIVLSGILCGLHDISSLVRTTAFLFVLSSVICLKRGSAGRPLFFLKLICFMLVLFVIGYIRADYVYSEFNNPEADAFFKDKGSKNPGEFDYGLYLKSKGISSDEELEKSKNREAALDTLRYYAVNKLKQNMLKEDAGILEAMLLGEKQDMDPEIKMIYQKAGISHIISISGLHVSLAGMLFLFILNRLKMGIKKSLLYSILLTVGYGLITGSSVSTIRAVIMLMIRYMGMYIGRGYDMITAAVISAVLLLFYRPYLIMQAGFQLSFAAVFAICCVSPILINTAIMFFGKKVNKYISAFLVSLAIQAVTLPIIIYHYYEINIYSLLLNLMVVPLAGIVICSGTAVIVTSIIGDFFKSYFSAFKYISVFAGAPAHSILKLYKFMAETSIELPFGLLHLGIPKIINIVVYYVFLFLLLFLLRREHIRYKKDGAKRELKLRSLFEFTLIIFMIFTVPFSFKRKNKEELVIVNMDVGQGDCCLLMHGDKAVLIDGGSSSVKNIYERVIGKVLGYYGIDELDAVIVSHADSDHINGVSEMLSRDSIRIKLMIMPGPARFHEKYDSLKELYIKKQNGSIYYFKDGDNVKINERFQIKCLQAGIEDGKDVNRHSPMLLIEYGDFKMLSTGDAVAEDEQKLYKKIRALSRKNGTYDIDFYHAAHHGSGGSNTENLMNILNPEYIFCSCGRKNRYGHPDRRIIKYAENKNIECLVSYETGAVIIESNGIDYKISTMRK